MINIKMNLILSDVGGALVVRTLSSDHLFFTRNLKCALQFQLRLSKLAIL